MNEVSATEKSVTDKNSNGVMTEDATVKLIAKDTSNIVESGSVTQSAKAIVGAVNGEVGVSKQIGGNVSDKPREPVNGIHEVSNGDVEESVKETLDAVSKSVSDNVSRLEENVDSMKSSELSPAKSSPKEHQQIAKEPKASSLEAKVPKKPIDDVKPEVSRKIPMPEIEHKPSGSLEALKDDSLVKDESDSSKPSESSGVPDETVQKLDDNIDLPSEVNEKPVANLLPEKKAQSGKLLETSKPVLAVQEDLKSTETEAQEKKVVQSIETVKVVPIKEATNDVITEQSKIAEKVPEMVKAEPKQNVRRKKRTTTEITGPLDDDEDNSDEPRQSKRVRLQHQPFQSPQVLSSMIPQYFRMSSQSSKPSADDKIEVFDKGDFLAVRNEDGTFFVCRTAQKVYKSSRRFKVRWLNDDDKKPGQFTLDFYDMIDFDCVLTNLRMDKVSKGVYKLPADERKRALNILERALNVEKGVSDVPDPRKFTEDGVDVSFVGKEEEKAFLESSKPTSKSESQKETPKKKAGRPKRTRSEPSESEADQDDDDSDVSEEYTPRKTKSREKIVEKERPKLKKIIIKEKEKSRKDKNKSSKKKEKKEKEAPAEVSSKKDKKTKESKKEDKEKSKKKTHKHSEKVPESKADKSRPALPPTTTKRMKTAEKTPKFKLTTTSAATTSAREAKRTTRSSGSSPKKTTPTNKSNRSG